MKCVKCGTDNNLEDRTANGGRCKNCNHPFAFDPQAGSKFTDVFFKRSLEAVSNENTLFFTRKQFLYSLEKRLKARNNFSLFGCFIFSALFVILLGSIIVNLGAAVFVWILIFMGISIYVSTSSYVSLKDRKAYARQAQAIGWLSSISGIIVSLILAVSNEMKFFVFLIGISFGLFFIYFGQRQINRSYYIPQKFNVTPEEVNTWLNRWMEINGSVEKLLPSPKEENSNLEVSPEISGYSFDRVIVCGSAEIAQFLIANNFHFEHNCAVLSASGYPQSIFNTVMEMLRRNPDLKVYAFHNASPRGIALVNHLRVSDNWFANSEVAIYDLGLLPCHVLSSNNMFIVNSDSSATAAKEMPAAVRESLSADEIAWLEEGNYVELESFSPQRLLRVVSRGIAKSQSISRGGSWDENDGGTLARSDDYYLYVSDSFG